MKRYSRNIALSEIGQSGQDALLDASVLVIGAGGLGSPVIMYLAAAGVGTIGVVDSDRVEISNLQRQILFSENSIGKHKADEAAARVHALNHDVKVNIHKVRFDEKNLELGDSEDKKLNSLNISLLDSYDIIADCSDNFVTRFFVNDVCVRAGKTLVSAAVTGFGGQVATFKGHLGGQPCYRCFCPEMPPEDLLPNCSSGGVLGSIAGVVGSIQATEIIKEILEIGDGLSGYILIYDGLKGDFRKVRLSKGWACKSCNANVA